MVLLRIRAYSCVIFFKGIVSLDRSKNSWECIDKTRILGYNEVGWCQIFKSSVSVRMGV